MGYILGVDGGNTKTDYFLFDSDGKFIAMYRGGTCSHEGLRDSFDGSYRVMKEVLDNFLSKYNLTPANIDAAVFGLAGVDIPFQQKRLEEVVEKLGFKNYKVVNDSALAIKIGTTKGYGVCSINGTGTSSSGIDKQGNIIQVGGIGSITGDDAGGRFLSRKVVRAVFDDIMRFGTKTSLTPITLELLKHPSDLELMEAIAQIYLAGKVDYSKLTVACFLEANKGDEVAIQLLTDMADNLARSAGGAVVRLDLGEKPEVVLAGSVYVKAESPVLVDEFTKRIRKYTNSDCQITVLQVPPATGAIVWALELYHGKYPDIDMREKLVNTVSEQLAKMK